MSFARGPNFNPAVDLGVVQSWAEGSPTTIYCFDLIVCTCSKLKSSLSMDECFLKLNLRPDVGVGDIFGVLLAYRNQLVDGPFGAGGALNQVICFTIIHTVSRFGFSWAISRKDRIANRWIYFFYRSPSIGGTNCAFPTSSWTVTFIPKLISSTVDCWTLSRQTFSHWRFPRLSSPNIVPHNFAILIKWSALKWIVVRYEHGNVVTYDYR